MTLGQIGSLLELICSCTESWPASNCTSFRSLNADTMGAKSMRHSSDAQIKFAITLLLVIIIINAV